MTRHPDDSSRAALYRRVPFRPCWNRVSGPSGKEVVLVLCWRERPCRPGFPVACPTRSSTRRATRTRVPPGGCRGPKAIRSSPLSATEPGCPRSTQGTQTADHRAPQTRAKAAQGRVVMRTTSRLCRLPARPRSRLARRTWIVIDYATCEATRTCSGLRMRDFCGTHSNTKLL